MLLRPGRVTKPKIQKVEEIDQIAPDWCRNNPLQVETAENHLSNMLKYSRNTIITKIQAKPQILRDSSASLHLFRPSGANPFRTHIDLELQSVFKDVLKHASACLSNDPKQPSDPFDPGQRMQEIHPESECTTIYQ